MYKVFFVLTVCFLAVWAKHEEVDGHSLYEVRVQTVDQVEILNDIVNSLTLDLWRYPVPGQEGLVLVPSDLKQAFQTELYKAGIKYKIEVQNIKDALDQEDKELAEAAANSRNVNGSLSFDVIHRYEVVDRYMVDLARRFPNLVTAVSGGRSFEGRDIKYLRISTTNFRVTSKPVIMIQSLLHAREWVTLPVALYAIKRLVLDVRDRDLVNNIDWIILPIANPDGYVFSHTRTRFWRKNRATGFTPGNACMGVDLNRNFDIHWGTASSNNPCMETFHGRGPFSEPETRVIRDILFRYRNRMEMYLDMHSFGSMILFAFGNGQLPPNAMTLNVVGVRMAQAIDRVKWPQNRNYVVGNIVQVLYYASGGSSDYAQFVGLPLSFTYELPAYRNNHNTLNGFLVQPEFIEQAGFETWEGIKAGARWILTNRRMKQLT